MSRPIHTTLCLAAILGAALGSPLAAQSSNPVRDHDITLDAGLTDQADGRIFGAVDARIALPIHGPLGFEFGTYLFALEGKRPHETYAALTWNRHLRLGAVRPAYDAVLPSVFAHRAPYLAYTRLESTRAFTTAEAMRHTAVPWGLSGEGSLGSLDWFVSAHDAKKGDFRSASAAFRWQGAGYQVMAATEAVDPGGAASTRFNTKIGARMDIGQVDFGLAYLSPDANDRPDMLAVDAVLPIAARTTLSVMGEFSRDGSDDAYGLAVTHDFAGFGRTSIAATDGSAGPGLHLNHSYSF